MYSTKTISEEQRVTQVAVAVWARKNGVPKTGRDYFFTEKQYEAYKNRYKNRITPNGTTELSKELGAPREAIALWARENGVEKIEGNGHSYYVFTEKQKKELGKKYENGES